MKKILFVLVSLVMCFSMMSMTKVKTKQHPQILTYDYYDNKYVECYGWSFYTPNNIIDALGLGFVHLQCDKNKKFWIRYECPGLYSNVEGIVDSNGNSYLGKLNVQKNKNMYIKLDNGEILTFTCKSVVYIKNGYYTGTNDIHQKYRIFSYFDITQEQIDKLCKYKIVKMRCELKYDVIDMLLDKYDSKEYPNEKFEKYYKEMLFEYNCKIHKENKQQELNNNPLKDF